MTMNSSITNNNGLAIAGLPQTVRVEIDVQDKFQTGHAETCVDTTHFVMGVKSFTCKSAIVGRWVAIRWTGSGIMTFCEIEVFTGEYSLLSSLLVSDVFVFILPVRQLRVRRRIDTKLK